MDPKQHSSVNLQHDQSVFDMKDLNSPVDQSGESYIHEEIIQHEVDVHSVTDYRLYKRRWIGLGGSP